MPNKPGDDDEVSIPSYSEGSDNHPDSVSNSDGNPISYHRNEYERDNVSVSSSASSEIASGSTPLHVAINKRNAEIVKLLLQNGADMYIKDIHGVSAMGLALSIRDDDDEGDITQVLRLLQEFDTKEVDTEEVGEERQTSELNAVGVQERQ